MITILLQMLLFGLPALIYIWAVTRRYETGLMLLSICLVALGLLTSGKGINRLAPLIFLPLASLGFLRALRDGEVPAFGPFFGSAGSIALGALGGTASAALVLTCAGIDLTQKTTLFFSRSLVQSSWLLVIYAALGPALGEELFFRGVVLSELKQKLGNALIAVLLVSFYFALAHLNRIAVMTEHSFPLGGLYALSLFVGGVACGYLKLGYGLAAAMAWHGMFNLVVLSLE